MTESQLKQFLDEVVSNSSLKEKLSQAKTAEDVIDVAQSAGFALTIDSIVGLQSEFVEELSDDELETASGGNPTIGAVILSIAVNKELPTIVLGLCWAKKLGGSF